MNNSRTARSTKPRKAQKKRNEGAIAYALFALYSKLCILAQGSLFAKIMCTYDKTQRKAQDGFFASLFGRILSPEAVLRFRRKISSVLCRNHITRHTTSIMHRIISCRCRDVGIFVLVFGLYSLLMCAVRPYFSDKIFFEPSHALISTVCIIFSFPLLREKISIGSYAHKNKLLKFLLFNVFGARDYEIYDTESKRAPSGSALILGMICGLLVLFVSPQNVIGCIFGIIMTSSILHRPETGIVTLFLIFPWASETVIFFTALISLISYLFKVLQLKRTFKFTYSDFWILLLAFLLLSGATVSNGGYYSVYMGIKMTVFALCLFPVKNMMASFEWIKRCSMVCILSACISCLYAYVSVCISENAAQAIVNASTRGISSFFPSAEHFAVYLSAMLPFAVFSILKHENGAEKRTSRAVVLICVISLIFTISLGGYISAIITVYVMMLTYSKKTFTSAVICAIPAVSLFSIISQFNKTMIFNVFTNDFAATQANANAWERILEYPMGGVGLHFPSTVHLSSYLSLAEMLGVPCLILLITVLFRYFRICLTGLYGIDANASKTKISAYIIAPMFSVSAMLIHAFFSCQLTCGNTFLLLFLIMGLGEATVGYAKEESVLLSEMKWSA